MMATFTIILIATLFVASILYSAYQIININL